jgi:hypothetical protein
MTMKMTKTILIMALVLATVPASGQKSCPLTQAQSQKSIDAWAKIAAFLTTEPRCVNCHGKVNPYIEGVGLDPDDPNKDTEAPVSLIEHGGGKQKHENTGSMDQGCKKCHNAMAPEKTWVEIGDKPVSWPEGAPLQNWTLAPNFLSFVDKDATTLCRQIKRATGTADKFLGHVKYDEGGFANFSGTSFYGNRGLSEEDLEGFNVKIQPPSITHAAVLKLGQDWVNAMGGKFQGDVSCGCELTHDKWSGQIHYSEEFSGDQGNTDLLVWSNRSLATVTVTVTNGSGSSHSHNEEKSEIEYRHYVALNGARSIQKESNQSHQLSSDDTAPITVDVRVYEQNGVFEVVPTQDENVAPVPRKVIIGKDNWSSCDRNGCKTQDKDIYSYGAPWPPISVGGKLGSDPNHVQGSLMLRKENLGNLHNGVHVQKVTFDLWRSGSN